MKNTLVLIVFFLNLIALSISIGWMYADRGFDSVITSIGLASSLVIATIEVTKKYSLVFKNKDLKLAMLGETAVGKTVYVTVLFDEMQKFQNELFRFAPSDVQTIELITYCVMDLYNGRQLPATMPGSIHQYSGIVNYDSKPIKKQFRLTVGDWAGEEYYRVAQAGQTKKMEWLHQSQYFDYVLQSDIIFLMLGVDTLTDKEQRDRCLSEMTAAVQVLCQKKDPNHTYKIATPVCLLFMKSDMINLTEGEILENVEGLIRVCKLRFKHFSYYFVSSIGKGNEFGKPMRLKPENVIEPLLWAIKKL